MDNGQNEIQVVSKEQSLHEIMGRIESNCNPVAPGENPEDSSGVQFFKDLPQDPEERKRANAVNYVYGGLFTTLESIASHSLKKAQEPNSPMAQDYEAVLKALDPLTQVSRALAEDRLPMRPDQYFVNKRAYVKDRVYAYTAQNFSLDGRDFADVFVLIRPNRWEESAEVRNRANRSQLQRVDEGRQARMSLTIKPKGEPNGEITVRVDREDLERDFEITYDIDIGKNEFGGILDYLKFPEDTGQREGHHFSSFMKAEELGVTFADILETMNGRLASTTK